MIMYRLSVTVPPEALVWIVDNIFNATHQRPHIETIEVDAPAPVAVNAIEFRQPDLLKEIEKPVFLTARQGVARSVVAVMQTDPERTWDLDEVGAKIDPRYKPNSASPAMSFLRERNFMERLGPKRFRLTAAGRAYDLKSH